jgi:hypothetical protein
MAYLNITTIIFSLLLACCTPVKKCPTVKSQRIVKDLLKNSPEYQLNLVITPNLLLINGAKIAKIKNGRFTDQNEDETYAPLMEAIYNEFKVKGDDPYREIIIYASDKADNKLIMLVQKTALHTHMAPTILIPVDFNTTTCNYNKPKKTTVAGKILKIPSNILIRQEKNKIFVDGKVVVIFENGKIPANLLNKEQIVIVPLLKCLKNGLAKLNKNVTPVLHITFDANLKMTKYILITAGKAGIYKLKTIRVLP